MQPRLLVLSILLLAACGGPGYYPVNNGYNNGGGGEAAGITCTGGAYLNGDQCYCPDGTSWDGAQCVMAATAGASCPGGSYASGDQCVCPDGTGWNGSACVGMAAGDPPPAPEAPPPDDSGTTYEVHQTYVPPPPDYGPPVNAIYHASFESASGTGFDSCQTFDTGDRNDANAPDMQQCSQFCTGYLIASQKCQCEMGPCR